MKKVGDMVYWERTLSKFEPYAIGIVRNDLFGDMLDITIDSRGNHCFIDKKDVRKLPTTGCRVKLKKPGDEYWYCPECKREV